MSITLIHGKPGAGKSYECVVHHILPALKDGRKVVTNIPLNIPHVKFLLGEGVLELLEVVPFDFKDEFHLLGHPDDYVRFQEWRNDQGQGCLFVLDECHLLFPTQGRGRGHSDLANEQIKFFSGHRHFGFDFIFLTQSPRKINNLIREDIEFGIELRKNRAVGDSSYRRYVYYFGEGKRGGVIQQESRKYEKKFFKLYQSHTQSEGSVSEANVKDIKKWHQHFGVRFFIVFFIGSMIFATNNMMHFFSKDDSSNDKKVASNVTPQSIPQSPTLPTKKKELPSFENAPYGRFDVFIDGFSDSSHVDDDGIYHSEKQVYFVALNSANFEVNLKLDDFYLAGYNVAVYSPCMVRLTYESASKLVYCRGSKPDNNAIIEDLNPL